MEKSLGQTIVIINQPGASGSIGTRSALEAAKDGYTWTAGAAQDLGAYQTLGSLDVPIKDWNLFLSVANVQVMSPSIARRPPGNLKGIARCHEGAARQDFGCDRRRYFGRSQHDGIDLVSHRRELSPRHLWWVQPGRGRDRLRRPGITTLAVRKPA